MDTGDLGRLDEDGYVWLQGRAKDLIIRSGHNIDPRLIEETLASHPAVSMAAAVGQPDSYAGEIPVAYVTLAPEQNISDEELHAFARENVSERPAAPARVEILSSMPLTTIGKIYKPVLRAQAAAFVAREVLQDILPEQVSVAVSAQEAAPGAARSVDVTIKNLCEREYSKLASLIDAKLKALNFEPNITHEIA